MGVDGGGSLSVQDILRSEAEVNAKGEQGRGTERKRRRDMEGGGRGGTVCVAQRLSLSQLMTVTFSMQIKLVFTDLPWVYGRPPAGRRRRLLIYCRRGPRLQSWTLL